MPLSLQEAIAQLAAANKAHGEAKAAYFAGTIDADTYLAMRRPYEAAMVAYHEAVRKDQARGPGVAL